VSSIQCKSVPAVQQEIAQTMEMAEMVETAFFPQLPQQAVAVVVVALAIPAGMGQPVVPAAVAEQAKLAV
jgi:hypothetical protein